MTPSQRAILYCKEQGWTQWKVEYWLAPARRRIDLFNMFDIVVLDNLPGMIGVQVTTGSNVSARIKKMQENPILAIWLDRGLRAEIWAYRKLKVARGSKRTKWCLRKVLVYPDRYEEVKE